MVWQANSNNHILNTLLMWISTRVFGSSELALRLPALLGAGLYIFVCYFICKSITNRLGIRLLLLICLTYNPFILDFMVAARGYSLANAFLLAALAIPIWNHIEGRPSIYTSCALASAALGLSFTANFSFAFVDLSTFMAILAYAMKKRKGQSIAGIIGWCMLPGLSLALLLGGWAMTHMTRDQLWWGAHSLYEMRRSLGQSSFYQLPVGFEGTLWYRLMGFFGPRLARFLLLVCSAQILTTCLDGTWRQNSRMQHLSKLIATVIAIAAGSITASWLAFRFFDLPLPLGRTGIYLVPLCTLAAGMMAAAPGASWLSKTLRAGIIGSYICLACYFMLCLRLHYFKEYQPNADVKEVYSVLAGLNHTYGVTNPNVAGLYGGALNYYRERSGKESFLEFQLENPELSAGRSVYVLDGEFWREFIEKEKLSVIYRGRFSNAVVAIRPDARFRPSLLNMRGNRPHVPVSIYPVAPRD